MNCEILKNGLLKYGYSIESEKTEKLEVFSSLLKEWNEKMNLTAVTDDDGISIKHFLDSIIPFLLIDAKNGSKVIDVGTGAGFPGVPIKIIREDLSFTFLDSLNKRINFLKEVSNRLGFENADFVHMRAEEGGKNKAYREKYDIAVSRAVAPLKILSELSLPFVKKGGIFAAYKSYDINEEIDEAKSMIGNLGGRIREIKEIEIPFSDIKRKIVIIEKEKNTPMSFPRRSNKIK